MPETIAAVVLTYNIKKLLTQCLDALLSGTRLLDKIILIDNGSRDNTPTLLQEKGYLENPCIDYIRLTENTGGAGGFYEGVKYGYTEFKYLTGQDHAKTSIVYEYPQAEGDPYYPVPRPENAELYKKYKVLADATSCIYFVGRLATYKYYNMD